MKITHKKAIEIAAKTSQRTGITYEVIKTSKGYAIRVSDR